MSNGAITKYYYEGSNLISEVTGSRKKSFLYDEANQLYGLIYNNKSYYYIKDILGNILGLIDNEGKIVVEYRYNAFGELLSITGSLKDTLGKENPFIYKGYYYDFETGLYYCKSRYYNPKWCRWINADDVSYLDPENINGFNLYAYCGNNPVMYYDSIGTKPRRITQLYRNVSTYSFNSSLFKSISKIHRKTFGGGVVYSKNGNLANCPDWLEIGAFYGEISPFFGLSIMKAEIGVAKIGFQTNKLFSNNLDAMWNPSLFAEIGAFTADGNIGYGGFSGKLAILSISGGVELGDSLKISGTLYAGFGASLDFTKGIKAGLGFWEVSIEFDWIELGKWIIGG